MFNEEYIMFIVSNFILLVCVLIGVAFLVLMERKVLGYIQIRKGPNKVGFYGIFQSFSDAIKLFTKEQIFPLNSNYCYYYISPIFSLFISLMVWGCIPLYENLVSFNLGILYMLLFMSLGVYSLMIAGWSSNSNYAMLGSMRAVAQSISYEVSMVFILLSMVYLVDSYDMYMFMKFQMNIYFIFISFPICLVWICISLAELNRTPFDFAEGESELVSGFNVEYSSGGFAMIFLSEYSSILFMSMLFSLMFLGGNYWSVIFYFKLVMVSFLFIWIRGTFPRFRYDKLMYLAWKSFLPFSMNWVLFMVGMKIYLFNFI